MPTAKDITRLLFIAYAVGYLLAVIPPTFIDPVITHVRFGVRTNSYWYAWIPIYAGLLGVQFWLLLWKTPSVNRLYASVAAFFLAIVVTLPVFTPELPHGNIITVGAVTAFLTAFTVFIWTVSQRFAITDSLPDTDGVRNYLNTLSTFVRQAAVAALAVFGALFFSAITTMFGYVETIAIDPADRFLLKFNTGVQISLYGVYSLVGPVRYVFKINLYVLEQYKSIVKSGKAAAEPDVETPLPDMRHPNT